MGLGQEWKGGDVKRKPGGGFKVNLFKQALEPYKDDQDKIIVFTDAYDVIFLSDLRHIVEKFKTTGARILFSAEGFCWPREDLADQYPEVPKGKRYLNSGLYMGYASDLYKLLNYKTIQDDDDDQLFFTEAYLDTNLRDKLGFKLDHTNEIFQNLNGAVGKF